MSRPERSTGGIVSPIPLPLIIGHEQVIMPSGRIECQPVYAPR